MDFRILGPLEIADGDRVVSLPAAQRSLLALLLLRANEVVPSDRLIEDLWNGQVPDSGRTALQVRVSQLRKALGPAGSLVVTQAPGYLLRVSPDRLDLVRFERLVAEADAAPADVAAEKLREALALWRGPPLADLAYEPSAQPAIRRLEELRLAALEKRVAADLKRGRHADLIGELEALIAEHPLQEHLRVQLMVALYRCGRQAEALAAYQDARRSLVEELGIDPGPELRELERAILRQDPALDHTPTPPARDNGSPPASPSEPPNNLPSLASRFVGRERELAELQARSGQTRLLTLTGVGGVGKTRLALQLASSLLGRAPDGVWFVDLAPLTSPMLVPATVAGVLGLREGPGRSLVDQLVALLRRRELVVILDNCEHVIAEVAALTDQLVRSCPHLTILATSREPLRIEGEQVYRVPTLALPADAEDDLDTLRESEAVSLFVERARAQSPGFALNAGNASAIVRVCRRLDGIPLAIELAAARMPSMSPAELDARLDHRFELLTGGSRTALRRQQTLRALIDWSYDHLPPPEQKMLERLSVFAGGFDLPAAEAVAESELSFDLLGALVDKSLIQVEVSASVRYRLLDTLRDYAATKLAERGEAAEESARRAHREHYLTLAEEAAPHLIGQGQREWLDRIELELDNLRAAMSESLRAPDPEPGLRLAAAQRHFWLYRRGLGEGQATICAALDRPNAQEPTLVRGRTLVAAARLLLAGDTAAAAARAEAALAIAQAHADDQLRCEALYVTAGIAANRRDDDVLLDLTDEALAVARSLDDPRLVACLLGARLISPLLGSEERIRLGEQALALIRQTGDHVMYLRILGNLAYAQLAAGQIGLARRKLIEARQLFREAGDQGGLTLCICNLGFASYLDGANDEARELFEELLRIARRDGDLMMVAYGQLGRALLARRGGDLEGAAELHGAADALHEKLGTRVDGVESEPREEDMSALRVELGDAAFEAAYRRGWAGASETIPALA